MVERAISGLESEEPETDEGVPAVQSIKRAADIVRSLGTGVNTLTDIAGKCGLSKSTVHRLLRALEGSGLAIQNDSDHRYYLGPLMTCLVANYQKTYASLLTCSLREMQHLNDTLGETIDLCIMPALQNIILHEIPSKHDLRVSQENRRIGFVFAGATVRVLLSHHSDESLRAALKHLRLSRVTDTTVTNKEEFLRKVQEARIQGYAISLGEKVPGAVGIAAPLMNYYHPAAISILGPESRIGPGINEFVRQITASAARISANIAEMLASGHGGN